MSVGEFDPNQAAENLTEELVETLCEAVKGEDLTLDRTEVSRYALIVKHPGWKNYALELGPEKLKMLIKLFTLGEEKYSEWSSGEKSPVILFVRELKKRNLFDESMNDWIKRHTSNKFLPHGSLMDLL